MDDGRQQVLESIRSHLTGRGIAGDTITVDAKLTDDLDLDSLDTVELTVGMEERFGIEIPDADLEGLETVGDAVELIVAKMVVSA